MRDNLIANGSICKFFQTNYCNYQKSIAKSKVL